MSRRIGRPIRRDINDIITLNNMTLYQLNDRLWQVLTGMGVARTALTDQANFTLDLGLDSLDFTDLLIQIESYFGIRIPDEDWWKLETVGQLKAYLVREVPVDGRPLTQE